VPYYPAQDEKAAEARKIELFLGGYLMGTRSLDDLAIGAWKNLQAAGQKLVKDRVVLDGETENLAELKSQAIAFVDKQITT
jgi:hypothetical protein